MAEKNDKKPKTIPIEFKKYFWDTELEKLDIFRNKRYIIARLYCYGNLQTLKWINETYSDEDIEDTARNYRDLKPLVANYLKQQYNLSKDEMAYYKTIESINMEYWRANG